jgi:hypothetical protein
VCGATAADNYRMGEYDRAATRQGGGVTAAEHVQEWRCWWVAGQPSANESNGDLLSGIADWSQGGAVRAVFVALSCDDAAKRVSMQTFISPCCKCDSC